MAIAKVFDKSLKGNWLIIYMLDLLIWFIVGYICGGGTLP